MSIFDDPKEDVRSMHQVLRDPCRLDETMYAKIIGRSKERLTHPLVDNEGIAGTLAFIREWLARPTDPSKFVEPTTDFVLRWEIFIAFAQDLFDTQTPEKPMIQPRDVLDCLNQREADLLSARYPKGPIQVDAYMQRVNGRMLRRKHLANLIWVSHFSRLVNT